MVNTGRNSCVAVLLLALGVLGAAAAQRSAEYDEQYTLFLTAGVARPAWPAGIITASQVRSLQSGHTGLGAIARDLRRTDVHPPLYFWALALWRRLVGPGLLPARLFSVLCSVAALAAVGMIARCTGVPPALAMLLTLGCYGFAYTGAIARNFALAQALLLWGTAALLAGGRRWQAFLGGALLGAASFANYLAVFVGVVVALLVPCLPGQSEPAGFIDRPPRLSLYCNARPVCRLGARREWGRSFAAALGFFPFLLGDVWFFVAQRDSRSGQFPAFHWPAALSDLAHYAVASVFGGLPLYLGAPARGASAAVIAFVALAGAGLAAARWRHIGLAPGARWWLLITALATPSGLLALGAGFRTTPITLRYLVFALPFAASLLAGALASLPPTPRRLGIALVVAIQSVSLTGMTSRLETMQPARATAAAAVHLARDGLVIVPRGNDGVGIVGAFALEAPPGQRLLVVARGEASAQILSQVGAARRVVLALLAQDADSRATLPALRAAFATPCWRRLGEGYDTVAFDWVCAAPPQTPAAAAAR